MKQKSISEIYWELLDLAEMIGRHSQGSRFNDHLKKRENLAGAEELIREAAEKMRQTQLIFRMKKATGE